eukprot:CAMPEP_0175880356 /NCGR_PEP_ID=MMETSP0107_2-20121207/42274_1 /TAXON_ID=195067 ORGANISM="Goniomonas pacifica, Strain CCMP1869" /NCGR_SAMPLE_ID=MMETSP0107_2 /ASSEMBLY_ACC=CAM_ASM_000203 /LENGTH=280 /DNA_ID=CAMNT_0017200095 /DNA_START=159 /DNA_END=1000 /DNA_ORIENTATION=+
MALPYRYMTSLPQHHLDHQHLNRPDLDSHRLTSHRLTSHRLTSHRLTSHRLTSHRLTSHRLTSHRLTSHRLTSHRLTSHRLTSHRLTSHRLTSHRLTSHRLTSHRLTSHRLTSHRLTSHRLTSSSSHLTSHRLTSYQPPLSDSWKIVRSRNQRHNYYYHRRVESEEGPTAQYERPIPQMEDMVNIQAQLSRVAPGWSCRLSKNVAPGQIVYMNDNLGTAQWHSPSMRDLRYTMSLRYPGILTSLQGNRLIDAVNSLLCWSPNARPTAEKAKAMQPFCAPI